jgi:hypothetical protein
MDRNYNIDINDGILAVRFLNNPGPDDICASLDDASKITPGRFRLWDFTCGVNLTNEDIQKAANHAKSNIMQSGKVAIVAPQDLTFGIFKVFAAHRDEERIKLDVFRTEDEAVWWLKKGDAN